MPSSLRSLLARIDAATGADPELDADIEKNLRGQSDRTPNYTSSVDRCLELLHTTLPDWHWHLGRNASGQFPYATLTNGNISVSADNTTVPLVLLAVILQALIEQRRSARKMK
ncbi:MAG: hypothetical protein HQ503_01995 [Rhodospirillales bacterium]|nr:hypothetical protein [Rhodospirillales bacterium]